MKTVIALLIVLIHLPGACLADGFLKPASMNEEQWASVQSYLLPYHHPLRKKLDKIFADADVLNNKASFNRHHFYAPHWKGGRRTVVAKHLVIKGYLFKLFLDEQQIIDEWKPLMRRIQGARAIGKMIEEKGWGKIFKVPGKWLYPLQSEKRLQSTEGAHFVLVVENVGKHSPDTNWKLWKKGNLKEPFLKKLYTLLSTLGLKDSVYIDNIPFCKDGRVAFLDTEHFEAFPVPYWKLGAFLNTRTKKLWEKTYTSP